MSSFDFYDLADASIVAHARGPAYPVPADPQPNVASGRTLGGIYVAEIRGATQRKFSLHWSWVTAAHLEDLIDWDADYL